MKSIWHTPILSYSKNTAIIPEDILRPNTCKKLETDLHDIDTVIIGAGICGILTGYFLAQRGQKVVILEASRIGSGQTENTTAKITAQHGLFYDKLIKTHGFDTASAYAHANLQAIQQYINICTGLSIPCDMQILPAVLYTTSQITELEKEHYAATSLGIDCSYNKAPSLPFNASSCLTFHRQAQFNPLSFLYRLSEYLTVYEQSKVLAVKEHSVITAYGTVTAKNIVFATHYPFINMPGFYFLRMHQERSHVIALKNASVPDGMYYGIDTDGLSFRSYNSLVLMGGVGHRTGKPDTPNPYEYLQKRALQIWPDSKVVTRWSAQDCVPIDNLPYIGQYSRLRPYWYVATGFKKWGMTSSMVAATIISDLITVGRSEHAAIFAPTRKLSAPAVKNLGKEIVESSIGLGKDFLTYPLSGVNSIAPGEARIVCYKGRKVGIYKDKNGAIHPVSVKCPHLGCQLSWNPHEKSWDCPCHGSRFDYHGNLIDNPAQTSAHAHIKA